MAMPAFNNGTRHTSRRKPDSGSFTAELALLLRVVSVFAVPYKALLRALSVWGVASALDQHKKWRSVQVR